MKKLGIGCLVIFILLAAGATGVTMWAKQNADVLKERALASASRKIEREISVGKFGGNPFTGFVVRDIVVAGAAPELPNTLEVEALRFRLDLRSLVFDQEVAFKSVELLSPKLYLERWADGRSNLSEIAEKIAETAPEQKETSEKRPSELSKSHLSFETIKLSNCTFSLKLHRDEGEPTLMEISPVNVILKPAEEGSLDHLLLELYARMEGIEIDGNGEVLLSDQPRVEIKWKTNKIEMPSIPYIGGETITALRDMGINGSANATGTFILEEGKSRVQSVAMLDSVEAAGHRFGTGRVNILVTDSVQFDGKIGQDGPSITLDGNIAPATELPLDAHVRATGIDSAVLLKTLSPESPELMTGTGNADIDITGTSLSKDSIKVNGEIRLSNGRINYPTPTLKKDVKAGWAPIPFDSLTAHVTHVQPSLSISDIKLSGPAVSAAGGGALQYNVDPKTGKISGPYSFQAQNGIDTPNVQVVLDLNEHLGPFVAGKLTVSGNLAGVTSSVDSLNGKFSILLENGRIQNPYMEKASAIPLNDNLSHFSFKSLKAEGVIMDEVIYFSTLSLRSKLLDADFKGTIGFDGTLAAKASATMDPSLITTIKGLETVLPQLKGFEKLKKIDASFDLGGNIISPAVKWDTNQLIKHIGDKLIKEHAGKIEEKIKEKILDKTGINLDGVDLKDDNIEDKLKKKLKNEIGNLF